MTFDNKSKINPKNNFCFCLLFLGFVLFASSCTSSFYLPNHYYVPSNHNTLHISEKGDLKATANVAKIRGGNRLLASQLGYSPINNLAVIGSFQKITSSTNNSPLLDVTRLATLDAGYSAEGAIGSYIFLNPKPSAYYKDGILLDLYLGYGQGKVQNQYFSDPILPEPSFLKANSQLGFNKYFIQTGFHYLKGDNLSENKKTGVHFGFSWALKFAIIDFRDGVVTGNIDPVSLSTLSTIQSIDPFRSLESTIGMHVGVKKIKTFANIHSIGMLNDPSRILKKPTHTLQLGLLFELDELFNLNKSKKQNSSTSRL